MKQIGLSLILLLLSAQAGAEVRCRIEIAGKAITSEGGIFRGENMSVHASTPKDHPNRLMFAITDAYKHTIGTVIAAFYQGKMQIHPEIQGRKITIACLQ